jgi:hypothetical protein
MAVKTTVLPLKAAYEFGEIHGLNQEVAKIRQMDTTWDMSYSSTLRRGYIVELFQKKNLFEEFKREYWQDGDTADGKALVSRYLRIKERFESRPLTDNPPVADDPAMNLPWSTIFVISSRKISTV